MNRLTVRLALAFSLLGGVPVVGDAWARTAAPVPQPRAAGGGSSMNARAVQDARPTLDLLITVRLLAELLDQRQLVLDAGASSSLDSLLRPLSTAKALPPSQAAALNSAVQLTLTPSQTLVLRQARAALESRAQALMARARFAAPDGPLNLTLIRYGLMVPGGQATVQLLLGKQVNPFTQAGGQAALLDHLLALLKG